MAKTKISVLFATFSLRNNGQRTSINGMIEPMVSVVVPKVAQYTILEQPHPGSDAVVPFIEDYQNKKLKKKSRFFLTSFLLFPLLKLVNSPATSVLFKIRDFLSVIEFTILQNKKYDLFIGLESINAAAGIFLKKLGYFDKVVYLVSDYSTNRYKPKLFNDLYLALDRFTTTHSDYNWDVSLAMLPARIKMGLDAKKASPTIHVPNALYPKQIDYLPTSKITPNSLVFVGTLGWINGPDLAIESLKLVLKSIPSAILHIYGGGDEDLDRLKKLTKKLKLDDNVIFEGFISDQVRLSKRTQKHAIALAPYLAVKGSPRWWADATKIRLYLAAGVPVITTQVPPLGKEVEKAGAGLIAKDTPQDQARTIVKLLKDKKLFEKMKKNAISAARNNTWENTYMSAFKETGFDLRS